MSHRPRKRFGQHFLVDEHVLDDLVALIAPGASDHLVEIGPGTGALTDRLVGRVARLDLVELDRDLAARLVEEHAADASVHVHQGDALELDVAALRRGPPLRICGNLPYNISTPLLLHLIAQADDIADMTFMVQKEVADRVTAGPGNRDYGRLSVAAQYACETTLAFEVGPEAFRPPPRVQSAVMTLRPRAPAAAAADPALFSEVVRLAFAQRRKTLRNALKGVAGDADFAAAGIDPARRPETLSVAEFVGLANRLAGPVG